MRKSRTIQIYWICINNYYIDGRGNITYQAKWTKIWVGFRGSDLAG